jgi:hypothetical protein
VALACGPKLLLSHAGLTRDDAAAVGLPPEADAEAVAEAVDARLDEAILGWSGASPLEIPGLHRPGNARQGEARGVFSHRPGHPGHEPAELFEGPLRRRFDPRALLPGLTQVVGHSRDAKCRTTLGPWVAGSPAEPGVLRGLVVSGDSLEYRSGVPSPALGDTRVVFADGGMAECAPLSYALLDLQRLASP